MSIGTISKRKWLALVLLVFALGGCDKPGESTGKLISSGAAGAGDRRVSEADFDRDVIRVREDLARRRLWVLMLNEVRIFSTSATGARLIKRIALPNWSVVGLQNICMPDIALDSAGTAFISSNSQARVLRIDADRFSVRDFAIDFDRRAGMDAGFGALAFGADGTLFARTTPDGRLWKIDVGGSSASPAGSNGESAADACSITTLETATQLLNGIAAVRIEYVAR